jgi:hypothetical protein
MLNLPLEVDDTLASLNGVNQRFAELMPRLQQANLAFAEVARPLQRLSELDSAQRAEVGRRLRAAEQELEEVTRLIGQVLERVALISGHSSPSKDSNGNP